MSRFSSGCIYMIKKTADLDREFTSGGEQSVTSGKNWSGGRNLYLDAQKKDEELPIVFASADQDSGLLYWGVVEGVDPGAERGTVCRYSRLQRVEGEPPLNSLELMKGGRLSANARHGYALCNTPSFVR